MSGRNRRRNSGLGLFLAAVLSWGACVHAEDQPRMKIGAILALSGESGSTGAACRRGIEMALDEMPPHLKGRLEVAIEDDGNLPRNTVSAFDKLTGSGGVDAILSFLSNSSKAISHLAEAKRIPMIAIASDAELVKNRRYTFLLWVTPEQEVKALKRELECRGYRRVARISAIQPGILSLKQIYDREIGNHPQIVLDQEVSPQERDFRAFLTRLRTLKDVDAVFVNLFFGQVGLFAAQAREMGIGAPLFNVESFEDPAQVQLAKGALEGQWYVQADDPEGDFLQRFQKRFPGETFYTAANCHDAVGLAAAALEAGRAPRGFGGFLAEVRDFKGALGTYSASGDNRFSLPATVKVVSSGGFRKLAPAERICAADSGAR